MSDALAALAPHFFQVAYVVREIAAAENWFERTLAAGPFTRLSNMPMAEGCEYRGGPVDAEMNIALAWFGRTQLELIEPVRGPSLYTEFIERHGPGLHHIAFLPPSFDASFEALRTAGLEVLAQGPVGEGNRFAYFDCEGPGCSVIELLDFDEATRSFLESLRSQAD